MSVIAQSLILGSLVLSGNLSASAPLSLSSDEAKSRIVAFDASHENANNFTTHLDYMNDLVKHIQETATELKDSPFRSSAWIQTRPLTPALNMYRLVKMATYNLPGIFASSILETIKIDVDGFDEDTVLRDTIIPSLPALKNLTTGLQQSFMPDDHHYDNGVVLAYLLPSIQYDMGALAVALSKYPGFEPYKKLAVAAYLQAGVFQDKIARGTFKYDLNTNTDRQIGFKLMNTIFKNFDYQEMLALVASKG